MNIVECIQVFIEVAKGLSFSKAAERLGTSRSTITKRIAWLESEFDTQLLNRNTKRVSLTESGEILLENADALMLSIKTLKEQVRSPVEHLSGRIRVGTPPSFGAAHLIPAINNFLENYKDLQISLVMDDGRSDLIAENLDLSIRIAHKLKDTNQIAYKIGAVPQLLVATKTYLDNHGWPTDPLSLEQHNCLLHSLKAPTGNWQFRDKRGALHRARVGGSFNSNLGDAVLELAKCHHGISMHPSYMVAKDIEQGTLQVLLSDYRCEDLDIYAVVQSKRYLPNKVRIFVDHLRCWFSTADWPQVNVEHVNLS